MESHSPSRARRSARAWTARERLASGVGLDRTLLEVNMDPTDIDVLESRGGSGDAGAPSSSPGGTRAPPFPQRARTPVQLEQPTVSAPVARAAATASRWSTAGARAPYVRARARARIRARAARARISVSPAPTTRAPTRAKYAAAPEPAPEPERTPASSLLAPPPPPGRRRSVRRTNALWSSTPSSARLATGQALPRSDRTPIRWRSARAAGGPIPPRPSWTRKSSAHRTSGGIRQRSVSGLKSVGARWRRLRLWGFSS